jgi:hypothetical protein
MTPHSIVRSPCPRAASDRDVERGTMDVLMSGREGSATTVAGVVLGVETHLDLHVRPRSSRSARPAPGRADRADEREGLREPRLLGGAFGPRTVRRCRASPPATVPGSLYT